MTAGPLAVAILLAMAILLAAAVGLRRRYAVVLVEGDSMLPVLLAGDRILIRRVHPGQVRAGQVVVVGAGPNAARRAGGLIVKRVAALPGQPVPAAVLAYGGDHAAGGSGQVVPAGQVVLLGDNATASLDSRECGYYRLGDVRGVALRHLRRPTEEVMPLAASDPDSPTASRLWRGGETDDQDGTDVG